VVFASSITCTFYIFSEFDLVCRLFSRPSSRFFVEDFDQRSVLTDIWHLQRRSPDVGHRCINARLHRLKVKPHHFGLWWTCRLQLVADLLQYFNLLYNLMWSKSTDHRKPKSVKFFLERAASSPLLTRLTGSRSAGVMSSRDYRHGTAVSARCRDD